MVYFDTMAVYIFKIQDWKTPWFLFLTATWVFCFRTITLYNILNHYHIYRFSPKDWSVKLKVILISVYHHLNIFVCKSLNIKRPGTFVILTMEYSWKLLKLRSVFANHITSNCGYEILGELQMTKSLPCWTFCASQNVSFLLELSR